MGSVDVIGTYAEDVAVTSHQDVSAPVPVGESTCGGFVDLVLSQLMRCLVTADRNDESSTDRQVTR